MLAEPIFRMVGIDLDEDGDYCAAVAHFCTDPGGAGQVILWFIDGKAVAGEAVRMCLCPPCSGSRRR